MLPRRVLIIFAKEPRPGHVKTRLFRRGRLTTEQAAEIHFACMRDTLALASRAAGCQRWLLLAAPAARAGRFAAALRPGRGWRCAPQRGADLGERLLRAFRDAFRRGAERVAVIGTDTPWMGPQRIHAAFRKLRRCDVVLGPTEDGGYYLVGARRLVPEMFRGIAWSTQRVLTQTVRALRKARVTFRLLRRDFDLDRPTDLARVARMLRANPQRSPALAKMVAEIRDRMSTGRLDPSTALPSATLGASRAGAGVTGSSRRRGRGRRSRKRRPGPA